MKREEKITLNIWYGAVDTILIHMPKENWLQNTDTHTHKQNVEVKLCALNSCIRISSIELVFVS